MIRAILTDIEGTTSSIRFVKEVLFPYAAEQMGGFLARHWDDPAVAEIYQACSDHGRPVVMHAGREPRSPAYPCDTHAICSVDRVEQVLRDHPRLRLCIPHLVRMRSKATSVCWTATTTCGWTPP